MRAATPLQLPTITWTACAANNQCLGILLEQAEANEPAYPRFAEQLAR